jgi:hypothetical protein
VISDGDESDRVTTPFSSIDPGLLQSDEELDSEDELDFDAPVTEQRLRPCSFVLTEAEEAEPPIKRRPYILCSDDDSD